MMMSQMSILLEVYYTISDTGGLGADGLTVTKIRGFYQREAILSVSLMKLIEHKQVSALS